MIPIYDDYKIVLGSNKGNMYILNAFDFSYHEAFKIKNIPIILQLIKYGADLTIKNKNGKTPLTINPSVS